MKQFKGYLYWFKSGSISLMTRVMMMGFAYLNFFLMARLFGKNEFGTWVIFLTIFKLSESVRNAFIYNPLLRYLNAEEDLDKKDILSASLLLNLMVTVLLVLLMLAILFVLKQFMVTGDLDSILKISILAIFSFSFFSHFNFIEQAAFRFFGTLVSSVIQNLFLSVFLIVIYFNEQVVSLQEVTWMYALGYVLSALIALGFVKEKSGLFQKRFKATWMQKLFGYGKYTFATNLSTMINKSSKEWFLGGMLSNVAVATFAPALRVVNLFEIPLNALANVYYPKVVSAVKEGGLDAAKRMYEKSVGIFVLVMAPIVFVIFLFAEQIILILVGEAYLDAVPVLRIIVMIGLLEPFQRQFGITLNAIDKAKINFKFVIFTSSIGIAISVVSISLFGIMGAAYGTLLTYVISTLISQIVLKRHVGASFTGVIRGGAQEFLKGARLLKKIKKAP